MPLEKIKSDRLKKLEAIKKSGINPYPGKTWSRFEIGRVIEKFSDLEKSKKEVVIAGRLIAKRGHGGSVFANLEDFSGQMQLFFKKDELGQNLYDFFVDNFDIGDFIAIEGEPFRTQKGEKTILVKKYEILAKSINQLPEKWHGLKDVEERFRRRYLDLLMNKEVRAKFLERGRIIKKLREFFDGEGFIEVETPVLQPLPGGAMAKPFVTHLNALDMDLYLRVAPELYLKRLLVGGFEKIYEIGKCFRNEGMDKSHNPDFTIMEFYWAYADYEQLMALTEKIFHFLVGSGELEFQGNKINFNAPFKRISMRNLISEHFDIDIEKAGRKELEKKLKEQTGQSIKDVADCKIIDELFKRVRAKIIEPTFIINHPLEMSPLAKSTDENRKEAARFQLVVGGMEICNAYSELNDPQEQAERLKEQDLVRFDEESQRFDQDFIDALEYGMPPAAGFGLGVDRLIQLLTDSVSVREVILFPTMRPKE